LKTKFTLLIVAIAALAIILPLSTRAGERVKVEVDLIYASNQNRPTESSLSYLKNQLQTFNFSSYSLLRRKRLTLLTGQSGKLNLPGGRSMSLELEGVKEERAKILVKISDHSRQLLSTMFSISPGQTVLVGGPTYQDGSLIIAIKAGI